MAQLTSGPSAATPRSSPLALTVLALLHYQPLHPYGIQRLIKQWGKDQVVNVSSAPACTGPSSGCSPRA
jgi:hypothetical protein